MRNPKNHDQKFPDKWLDHSVKKIKRKSSNLGRIKGKHGSKEVKWREKFNHKDFIKSDLSLKEQGKGEPNKQTKKVNSEIDSKNTLLF